MERYLQATVPAARARVSEPAARSRAAFGGPPGLSITRSWLEGQRGVARVEGAGGGAAGPQERAASGK